MEERSCQKMKVLNFMILLLNWKLKKRKKF